MARKGDGPPHGGRPPTQVAGELGGRHHSASFLSVNSASRSQSWTIRSYTVFVCRSGALSASAIRRPRAIPVGLRVHDAPARKLVREWRGDLRSVYSKTESRLFFVRFRPAGK
jgi:hypothetical protein